MQEEEELRKEIAEKKKIMEKEFGSAPMNEQQFKGQCLSELVRCDIFG